MDNAKKDEIIERHLAQDYVSEPGKKDILFFLADVIEQAVKEGMEDRLMKPFRVALRNFASAGLEMEKLKWDLEDIKRMLEKQEAQRVRECLERAIQEDVEQHKSVWTRLSAWLVG